MSATGLPRPSPGTAEVDGVAALTMEQHAGIAAALAEGFPRADVLAQEAIDEDGFRAADVAWKRRLVADARGEGKQFAAYQAKRAEAEDWLRRPVKPLDDDLGAWLGFMKAWATAPAPFELLAGTGLRLSDVGRLGRRWEAALARDPGLSRRAARLAGEAKLPARITVEPGALRPFPWSPKPRVRVTPELPDAPEVETPTGPQEGAVVAPAVPSYLRDGTPGLGSPPGTHDARALPSYARSAHPDATAPVFYLPAGDRLPFSEAGPEPPPAARPDVNRAPAPQSGETVLSVPLPGRPATPFEPPPARKPEPIGETLPLVAPALKPALPFSTDPARAAGPVPMPAGAPPPPLTLEEHAALCAEIAFRPDHADAALGRRRLDPPAKAALDARVSAQRAGNPALETTWNKAYQAAYTRLVLSSLTGRG